MSQSWRQFWLQRGLGPRVLIAAISPLAVLLPGTIIGADSAAAAPAAGYTASLISIPDAASRAVAVDPATDTTYFADIEANDVAVVDDGTNTVTATIPLSGMPSGIAVDPVTDTVYVSLTTSTVTSEPSVVAIDGATNTVTQTIPLAAGSNPDGVAVDSATKTVFVAEEAAAAVAEIKEGSNSVTTVSTGSGTEPYQLSVDETLGAVWLADQNGEVQEISEASDSVTQTIGLGGAVVDSVAVDSATSTVYAATPAHGVAVINETSGAVGTYINIAAFAVAVDPGSGTVFASTYLSSPGTMWIIDASSNTVVDTIPRGGLQIAVNTATGSAYAAAYTAHTRGDFVLTPSAANAWSPIVNSASATFAVGTSGSFAIVGTALPAATYSETGALPTGVTLSPSGVFSGTPAAGTGGSYPLTLTASNGVAPDYSQAFTLTVDEPPAITSANHVTFTQGTEGSFTVTASGSNTPSFTESGALPPGITLTTYGVLSGTPESASPGTGSQGDYPITITATNSAGSVMQAFTLTVWSPPAVGIEGTDGELWVHTPQLSTGWLPLGGKIVAPPAVVAIPVVRGNGATLLFIATGTDRHLYIQSSTGWQKLGPATAECIGSPAAVVTGTADFGYTLTVACRGLNNALFENTAAVPATGQPQFTTGWINLGGTLSAGPAAAPVGGTMTFFVRGTNGQIFTRTLNAGYQPTPWRCNSGPAASVRTDNSTTYFACQGTDRALWYASNTGTGWTAAQSLGGTLIGSPAIAADSTETAILAEGTNKVVFQYTLLGATPGWTSLGGGVGGPGGVGGADPN